MGFKEFKKEVQVAGQFADGNVSDSKESYAKRIQ